jgi:micrococcal nuclease
MSDPAYTYSALVVRVVDGDTVRMDLSLGFKVWLRDQSFRLLGCNARELGEPGGKEARDHLATVLPAGLVVTLRSVKADKYGERFDAQIILPGGIDLVGQLVADGWAAVWSGRGDRPVPPWPRLPAESSPAYRATAGVDG